MNDYQQKLKSKMNDLVNLIYDCTTKFPKEETYSSASQWRRATLSVVLNYIEGYARKKPLVRLNFLEISYGSLQESKYLAYFTQQRKYISNDDYDKIKVMAEEIGAMLWQKIINLENSLN